MLIPAAALRQTGPETWMLTVRMRCAARRFFGRKPSRTIEKHYRLDDLGAFVVRQIDGSRNVKTIVNAFAETHKVTPREAELSVIRFIRMLVDRRAVVVSIP